MTPEEFLTKIMSQNKIENSVNAHYAISDQEMMKFETDMLCDLIKSEKRSDVLDKHFKNDTPIDHKVKAKIYAFATALANFHKLRD